MGSAGENEHHQYFRQQLIRICRLSVSSSQVGEIERENDVVDMEDVADQILQIGRFRTHCLPSGEARTDQPQSYST
jgi:hypothetical protein